MGPDAADAPRLRGELRDLVVQTVDFVRNKPYFVSDTISLVDVTIARSCGRLPRYRIDLKEAAPLLVHNLLPARAPPSA